MCVCVFVMWFSSLFLWEFGCLLSFLSVLMSPVIVVSVACNVLPSLQSVVIVFCTVPIVTGGYCLLVLSYLPQQ